MNEYLLSNLQRAVPPHCNCDTLEITHGVIANDITEEDTEERERGAIQEKTGVTQWKP